MVFKRRWVLATLAFTLIGAASSALFYFWTGWPVFAATEKRLAPQRQELCLGHPRCTFSSACRPPPKA